MAAIKATIIERGDWVKLRFIENHSCPAWRGQTVSGTIHWCGGGVYQIDVKDDTGKAYYTFDDKTATVLKHRKAQRALGPEGKPR